MTNARFASLHGLPVAPSPSRRRPLHFTNRALVTSWHSAGRRRGRLPSAARRRALRSGCDALGASRRPPLHFPRAPNADRSQCSISQWHMRIAHVGMVAIRLNVDNAMKPAFIVQRRWSRQGRAPPPPRLHLDPTAAAGSFALRISSRGIVAAGFPAPGNVAPARALLIWVKQDCCCAQNLLLATTTCVGVTRWKLRPGYVVRL